MRGANASTFATIEDRFYAKVVAGPDNCHIWTGARGSQGHGQFWWNGRLGQAHQWAFLNHGGVIPEGLELDHLCRVRRCVNPMHLEPVTSGENTRRGHAARDSDVQCRKGHQRTESNTRYRVTGEVICLDCKRIRDAERRARRGGASDGEAGQ